MYIDLFNKLKNNNSLSRDESKEFIDSVFTGTIPSQVLTEFLLLLNKNGFGSNELTGFALSMREASNKVIFDREVIDNCGTGGDGHGTFNISTTASLIASSAGVYVAKHGNKAVTSSSGSADILQAAGININLSPDEVSLCLEKYNFGFMFAPLHHLSMKHVAESRKTIAPDKTIFNILGPLTNPANAKKQLLGVYSKDLMLTIAETLVNLGTEKAMIVHSKDGLDEISSVDKTFVAELENNKIKEYEIDPKDFDIYHEDLNDLQVDSPSQSLELIKTTLQNEGFKSGEDITSLNSAAVIYVSDLETSFEKAFEIAIDVIKSGSGLDKLKELATFSNNFNESA